MPIGDYFKPEELKCGCADPKCDAAQIDMTLLLKLNGLRREFGEGMVINSARRCAAWNLKVGGESHSWHLKGKAADVHCPDGIYMLRLALLALKHGFRVGVKRRMLHLDVGDGPQVMFGYDE